jgi:hypothetical protein
LFARDPVILKTISYDEEMKKGSWMFKVMFQTLNEPSADSRNFARLTEAMNFVAGIVGRHGPSTITVNVLDDRDAIVFEHDELVRACAQVRT